ncbi:B12-binding domain-containing radical SAM protein [Streptacidiphilus fuscans]|uniref:B12-binding domain-containing radical SAM protein n=1 Tax=Streptacidiphilus fuscans TaxID=2789292 RepID=A0A931FIK4_9ACTN|nr:radical SAM protein [Streptacidiphilus fuscans]MBF9071869.1 B12-binding domain-containing radical SAM protein [Streptacidiphilus fuscans]
MTVNLGMPALREAADRTSTQGSDKPLVILVYPKVDHEKDYVYHWMPFSLLTIAKALLSEGSVDVILFDGNQADPAAWERLLDEQIERAVCIGVSVMTGGGQIGHALSMVRAAKEHPACPPVVFGGPHVNVEGEQTARHPLVDAVLQGPGQNSMPAFVDSLLGQLRRADVPGLITRLPDGELLRGPTNPPRTGSLGAYPWHLLNVADYIRDDPTVATRTLNHVSSQGCVYQCQFCYELTYQRKYSAMAAEPLLADVCDLQARFGINGVKFYDADWFVNLRRAIGFCEGLIERDLGLRWAASINPNDILKARRAKLPLLEKVAASGCSRLLMGVESGNDRVLADVVKKEVTRTQILDVAGEIAEAGILGSYTFIVGFPGESEVEQEETYSLIEELRGLTPIPETRVHLFAPYPGTPLYDEALKYGFEPPKDFEGWSHFDYYTSLTPWTSQATVDRARDQTRMRLAPTR